MNTTYTVAVIAANGRSGAAFVERALAAGMHVRAGVHGDHAFEQHDHLVTIDCDATKPADVRAVCDGADAVVSFIGHTKNSPRRVQTEAIKVIIATMQELGIRRLVSLTGTGVRWHGDTPSIFDRIGNVIIKKLDPERIADGIAHADVIRSTQIDWTVIRVLKLGNRPFNDDNVTMSVTGPAEFITSRRKVAAAVVQVLEQESYIRQAPIIQ